MLTISSYLVSEHQCQSTAINILLLSADPPQKSARMLSESKTELCHPRDEDLCMVRVLSIQPQKERMGIDRDVEKQTDGMWGCPEK